MEAKILEISEWVTPASSYKEERIGDYRIGKSYIPPGFHVYHGIDGYLLYSVKEPFQLTTLEELRPNVGLKWRGWMFDSPTDYRAMQKYAEQASGRVLTTGLGLGLLTHELCKNSEVEKITIVEISQDAIDLVGKYLPDDPRIEIVCDDFWNFVDSDSSAWDFLIVDIWAFWGLRKHLGIYRNDIIPANKKLVKKYPNSKLIFHSFAGMPTDEQLEEVARNGDLTNPLVIDPLIYGLGNGNSPISKRDF